MEIAAPVRAALVLALLVVSGCGEPPPAPAAFPDPVPYDAAEAEAYARRRDELRSVLMGSGRELEPVLPDALDAPPETPEAAWALVTDPATPLPVRMRAARVAADVLPVSWLARVVAARRLLRSERELHQWGRRASPTGALFLDEPREWERVKGLLRDTPDGERARELFGHVWELPRAPQGFLPITWAERCAAPWPLQVEECLEELLRAWAPPTHGIGGERATDAEVAAWLDAVLALPLEDDDDAWLLGDLTMRYTDAPDVRVLARVHAIARDTRFSASAGWIVETTVYHLAGWDDPDARGVAQVLLLDLWESDHAQDQKQRAAYALRRVADAGQGRRRLGADPGDRWPATAVLAASRLGLDPAQGDPWTRAYCYLFSACEAHPLAPFLPTRHEDPDTAEEWIERFRDWFDDEEDALEAAAAREADSLANARRRLAAAR